MRKWIFVFLLAVLPSSLWAAGTCIVSDVSSTQIASLSNRIADPATVIITLTCTADSSAATFPSTTVSLSGSYPTSSLNTYNLTGYFLYQVGETPGTTAPTNGYTVTIKDSTQFALDLGLLSSNGSSSSASLATIANATTSFPIVRSSLTVAITGNAVNSANITLDLIFRASGVVTTAVAQGAASTTSPWTITPSPTKYSFAALSSSVQASLSTAVVVKNNSGNVYGVMALNGAASTCWIQFINAASAPTLGTNVIFSIPLPASTTQPVMVNPGDFGLSNFSTGISVGIATTATGNSACGTAGNITVFYS